MNTHSDPASTSTLAALPADALALLPSAVTTTDPVLRERLLAWVNDPTDPARRFRFSEAAARSALAVANYRLNRVLVELQADGLVIPIMVPDGRRYRGWSLCGAVAPRRTLAELAALVEAAPEPSADAVAPRRGRKGGAVEQEAVIALTPAQRRDIKGVFGLIAERAPGAGGSPANLPAEFLARHTIHNGRRVWALEQEVPVWADDRARAKALARGQRWDPSRNEDVRIKHVGAIRLAMRFAVSKGWLDPTAADAPIVRQHAAEWHPHVLRWRTKLERRAEGRSRPAIRKGVQTLAMYATRRGELDPRTTKWAAVLDEIEADVEAGLLQKHVLQAVRFVWREIGMLARIRTMPRSHDQRLTVVPSNVIDRTVASVAEARSAGDIDFSGWEQDGGYLHGLIEGPYGLRRIMWFIGGREILVAGDDSLPKREYERTYRRRPHRETLTPLTMATKLRQFALLAGWAMRHDSARFAEGDADTLLTLLDSARLTRYADWRGDQPQYLISGKIGVGNNNLRGIFATCRRVLADVQMLADHAGDAAVSAKTCRTNEVVERLAVAARTKADNFRDCLAINAAWRADGQRWGLEKLVALRDVLARDACAASGLTVEQQIEALREWRAMPTDTPAQRRARNAALQAMTWRTEGWATALRRATLVQLVRKVPMREDSLRHLTLDMIVATSSDGRSCPPWTPGATILIHVPGEFTKNGDPYHVAYVARDMAGQPAQEEGAARWLLELMFAPGGGREWFVERAPAGVETASVFPGNPRRGNGGHGTRTARTSLRMADDALTTEWREIVTKHGTSLGVNVPALRAIQGGLGIHSVRYLFGRFWAFVRGKMDFAADMLHHGELDVTKQRYVGTDPTAASHDVLEVGRGAFGTAAQPDVAALVESLRRENEELRRRLTA